MPWSHFPAYFFAGVFFANFVPHFVSGVLGRTFPTPFASPPFRGPSPPRVNVLYGMVNLAVAYVLLLRVGDFEPRNAWHASAFGLGLAAWALMITRSLARIQGAASASSNGSDSKRERAFWSSGAGPGVFRRKGPEGIAVRGWGVPLVAKRVDGRSPS